MDWPLALRMEQYLAERGSATAEEFAQAFRVAVPRCREEVLRLVAFGAEIDAGGVVRGVPYQLAA